MSPHPHSHTASTSNRGLARVHKKDAYPVENAGVTVAPPVGQLQEKFIKYDPDAVTPNVSLYRAPVINKDQPVISAIESSVFGAFPRSPQH